MRQKADCEKEPSAASTKFGWKDSGCSCARIRVCHLIYRSAALAIVGRGGRTPSAFPSGWRVAVAARYSLIRPLSWDVVGVEAREEQCVLGGQVGHSTLRRHSQRAVASA
jgi:hypothetical protein